MDTVATQTITRPATSPTVPEVPAEQLDRIETRPKRLAEHKLDRTPTVIGKARASVAPRAWTMGGRVD